jgi:hypothetical protein
LAAETDLQWCDSSVNPAVMGCQCCELWTPTRKTTSPTTRAECGFRREPVPVVGARPLSEHELSAACRGFSFFGFIAVVAILEEVRIAADTGKDIGELEMSFDKAYAKVIDSDQALTTAFERHFAGNALLSHQLISGAIEHRRRELARADPEAQRLQGRGGDLRGTCETERKEERHHRGARGRPRSARGRGWPARPTTS